MFEPVATAPGSVFVDPRLNTVSLLSVTSHATADFLCKECLRTSERFHFLKSFANASRASVGGPDEVSRSTTIRVANSSHSLRACLFTIRAGIGLLHSRRAPGSKCVH